MSKKSTDKDHPSVMYRAMIYFAVATFHLYRNDIEPTNNVGVFRLINPEIVRRVFDEGIKYMKYEISSYQMDKAILAYISEPASMSVAA